MTKQTQRNVRGKASLIIASASIVCLTTFYVRERQSDANQSKQADARHRPQQRSSDRQVVEQQASQSAKVEPKVMWMAQDIDEAEAQAIVQIQQTQAVEVDPANLDP